MIFGLLPVAPGLLAKDNSDVPACCRRLGAHHCALLAAQLPAGVSVKGICDLYGHFPSVLALPNSLKAAFLKGSPRIFAAIVRYPAAPEQGRSLCTAPFNRSRQKRGPPSLPL
jgi:hypothetical protein